MRTPLTTALILAAGLLAGVAQPLFKPDAQFTNEINLARARLQGQRTYLTPAELTRLAETLARSNRLATIIAEAAFRDDFTNAAALLKEFPGTIDDVRRYGQPLLYCAVNENRNLLLDFLLEQKANPDTATPFGSPVLIQAIQYRRWSMAAQLIEAGSSVTRTNNQGCNAAGMFFENWYPGPPQTDPGWTNLVSLMLEHGLDPFAPVNAHSDRSIVEECLNRESSYGGGLWGGRWGGPAAGSTPVYFGDLLLTNNPSPVRRTPLGDTALHVAAYWQRTNAIEFLLSAGFSINQTNNAGLTPLQSLVGAGPGAIPVLYGGGPSFFIPSVPRPIRGAPGPSPAPFSMTDYLLAQGAALDVFSAAGLDKTNELAALLATNATLVNARDGYGRTPLHYAALTAQYFAPAPSMPPGVQVQSLRLRPPNAATTPPDAVSLLLQAGADPSAATTRATPQLRNSASSPAGTTPLHIAARNGNLPLVRALLLAKADAKLADANGDTPLHLAARTWQTNNLSLLLAAHAPLEATNLAGQTPLRAAVETGTAASVAFLLDAGASPTNGLGDTTLLHLAAERGSVDTINVLLKHRLALDGRDGEGRTPFEKAVSAKGWNALTLLEDKGADINAADNEGNTALHLLSASQDDMVSHEPEEPWWTRWERKQLSSPGWSGNALRWLMSTKLVSPPPGSTWTNTSLSAWLVEHGAKINATNHAGQTPLHVLCGQQWFRWMDFNQASNRLTTMLAIGARLDLTDTNGQTPLHIAATNASPSVLSFLVQKAGRAVNSADNQGRTLLQIAVEGVRDNPDRVKALLDAGANPNVADQQGRTPLQLALQSRNDGYDWQLGQVVQMLLTNKADPNLADRAGNTPLHLVMMNSATNSNYPVRDMVSLLLTNGANLDITNCAGFTPLHLLAMNPNPYTHPVGQLGALLLDSRWNFAARDRTGETPVHLWAVSLQNSWDDLEFYKRVLTNYHLVNLTNDNGDTPLHLATRAGKDYIVRALLEVGANPALKNVRGETALRLAVEQAPGYLDQYVHPEGTQYRFFDSIRLRDQNDVNRWLDADPSLASLTNRDGVTPLMAATDAGNPAIIDRLLELGAPLDALSALRLGRMAEFRKLLPGTPRPVPGYWLFEAVRFGCLEALQELVAAGGDVQATDGDGDSVAFRAEADGKTEIAQWLNSQGARKTLFDAIASGDRDAVESFINADAGCVNATNHNAATPLFRAAVAGKVEIASLLLARGAKADAQIPGGWTALHVAAMNDSVELAQLLLKAGASPNQLAQGGMGPLHLAAACGKTNVAELLLQNGADVNLIPPQQGGYSRNSPLHWAAHYGKLDLFKLLLAHGADLNALNQQNQTPLELARANARGMHLGFSWPPGVAHRFDPAMQRADSRDALIKQLEAAASGGASVPASPR